MATSVTWNNTSYSIPAAGEINWSSLSNFLIALGGGAGQPGAQVSGKAQKVGMRVVTAAGTVTVSDVDDCVVEIKKTSGAATLVSLPAGVAGRIFMIVDGKGDAASNNITISPNPPETIMGASNYVMNVNKSAVIIGYDGSDWKIIATYEGASIPDSRLATISTAGKVANSATTAASANTASAIVARDASGNFSAGTITANLSGNATTATSATTATTATTAANISGSNFTNDIANVGNSMTVSYVGGKTSSAIATSVNDTVAATNLNTASTIVKRDASGNFSAGTITANLSGNATTATSTTNFSGSLSGDVTGTQSSTAISDSTVTGKALTGFVSGAGTVSATDTILQAFNKIDGNVAGKEPTITTLAASKGGLATNASAFTGVVKANSGTFSAAALVNADVSASAAIDHSKLANITAGSVLLGNASNVPTATALTGDVTVNSTGVTAISSGVIVNADVNASAAIAGTKISPDFGSQNVTTTGSVSGTNVINAGYGEFTQISTPSNPAASKTRIYAKSDGKLYRLDSSGNETAVGSGSGTGFVNYLSDWYDATKTISSNTTSAANGNLGVAGSFPSVTSAWCADVTSGSNAIVNSSDQTLRGTTLFLTQPTGTSTSGGTFIQTPVFNIDGEDLGKPLTVQFDVAGNTTDDDWDVVAVRYTVSGSTATFAELIPIAGNVSTMTGTPSAKIPVGVRTFSGFFVTGSTASDVYSIRWRRRAGSTQLKLDSLIVGPQQTIQGFAGQDWQSYTPTLTSFGTTTNVSGWYRQVGSDIQIKIRFTSGTHNGAALGVITLPSGISIDTTKTVAYSASGGALGYVVGRFYSDSILGTIGNSGTLLAATTTSTTQVYLGGGVVNTTATGTSARIVNTSQYSNNTNWDMEMSFPVANWSANVQMAARAVEEYASNSTWDTDTNALTAFVNGPQGSQMGGALTANRVKRVRFQTPILPTDTLVFEVADSTEKKWVQLPASVGGRDIFANAIRNSAGTLTNGGVFMKAVASSTTDIDITFNRYASTSPDFTSILEPWPSAAFWRLRKISGGAAVGFPIAPANITLINNSDNYGGNTKLGLMQYVSGTNYNGGISPTLSGTGLATTRGVFVPYQMSDGTWRLKFNFRVTATSTTGLTVTINGVTFKNVSNYFQSVSNFPGGNYGRGNVTPNTGQINLSSDLSTTTWAASGDVELDSKPTWAY